MQFSFQKIVCSFVWKCDLVTLFNCAFWYQSDSQWIHWLCPFRFYTLATKYNIPGLVFTNIGGLSLVVGLKVAIILRPLPYLTFVLHAYSQRVTLLRQVKPNVLNLNVGKEIMWGLFFVSLLGNAKVSHIKTSWRWNFYISNILWKAKKFRLKAAINFGLSFAHMNHNQIKVDFGEHFCYVESIFVEQLECYCKIESF